MKKHGCKTLLIVLAAVLCLFSASGAIFAKMLSQPAGAVDPSSAADSSAGADPVGEVDITPEVDPNQAANSSNAAEANVTEGSADANDQSKSDTNTGSADTISPAEAEAAEPAVNMKPSESAVQLLNCRYFNEREFLKSVNGIVTPAPTKTNDSGKTQLGQVKGGIVPHHLLAGRMISAFFGSLAKDAPDTIILIAPNHKLIGASEVHTSAADWATAFGTLEADRELAAVLLEKLNASENNALMENEHSISALIPYIKYYMPQTKIVPVLVHGSYTPRDSEELGELLAEMLSKRPDAVILASIDFSHYLEISRADKMDEKTLAAISSWNIDEISMMSNDNLDSVPSAITLLSAMDTIGAREIEVTGHGNSARIIGSGYDYTTSYYTMFFRKSN